MWSIPSMPYMSPAAIGWMVVRLRGAPSDSNRSPIAWSIASGQPSPLEELTVTVAPSGIRRAASTSEIVLSRGMNALWVAMTTASRTRASVRNRRGSSLRYGYRNRAAGLGGFGGGEGDGEG